METKPKKSPTSSKPNKENDPPLSFLKFSGMTFEMLGFILIGYWLGNQLDKYVQTESIFTLAGILLGIAGAMINLFRKLPKD